MKILSEVDSASSIYIANRFDVLIKDKNFNAEYKKYILGLINKGKNVVVFLQVPKFNEKNILRKYAYESRYGISRDYESGLDDSYIEANEQVVSLLGSIVGVTLIDLSSVICKEGGCSQLVGGYPIYFDDDHLNAYGSRLLGKEVVRLGGLDKVTVGL